MDGLGRDDRVRYDTPSFAGFKASTSYIADGGGDLALTYGARFGDLKLAAALAYADPAGTSDIVDDQINGSVSMLHSSGFNFTFAGGIQNAKPSGKDDGKFYYGKIGYRTNVCSLGETAFALDYGSFQDITANNDDADTFGAQLVQYFEEWATEYYLGFRHYNLDREHEDYDKINSVLTGFRVKF